MGLRATAPSVNGANGSTPVSSHLADVRAAEAEVEQLERERTRLRHRTLAAIGLAIDVGSPEDGEGAASSAPRPAKPGPGESSPAVPIYPLIALAGLAGVFEVPQWAFFVLAPDIGDSLGLSKAQVALAGAAASFLAAAAIFGVVALTHLRTRRASLTVAGGGVFAAFALLTMLITNVWGLLGISVGGALAATTGGALHRPLLVDTYAPGRRAWVLALYRAAQVLGGMVAAALVAVTIRGLGWTWRGAFAVIGVLAVAATVVAARLREPGYGRLDTARIRAAVEPGHALDEAAGPEARGDRLGLGEMLRRTLMIPSMTGLLVGYVVFGIMLAPLHTYLFFWLDERWHMSLAARGAFLAAVPVVSVAALVVFGRQADTMFSKGPARLARLAGAALVGGSALVAVGVLLPLWGAMAVAVAVGLACLAVVAPALDAILMSLVHAEARPHAAALSEVATLLVGSLVGVSLLSAIESRFGYAPAFVLLLLPALTGLGALQRAATLLPGDIDAMVDSVIEDSEVAVATRSGHHLPLLACRHIDFSYGQLQVLFDVMFTVDDGEIVALLGTNGAGKSTLLRVISGLSLPQRGSVRYRGRDITHFGAERRVGLGMTQIPGGKAVFGPLSVAENMRLYGFTLGRSRAAVDAAIDRVFETFPKLEERRNQMAQTLSGGEQQMVALGKALMLKPSLLLIDELSLGLAPVVVGELLEMVRRICEGGTAVVLVEQSVNVALTLADHAYFMEKGEIRFDGSAAMLLRRTDLLRSVFLEGAAKGMADVGDAL